MHRQPAIDDTVKQALADALKDRGYETLTPVQEAVTNPEYEGVDLLVSAQTGSGKTVGFGLAIAPNLLGDLDSFERADAPLALVIAPTRELALQVKRELQWLYAKTGAVVASCVGGMDMRDERRSLARGAHMVVATPGRLRDHIMRGSIELGQLRAVVLDEADEMLDLGFREDLEFILGEAPVERQTLLFSATVPRSIGNLAKSYQRDAVRVSTVAERSQHTDIEYRALTVAGRDGENAIINILRFYEAPNAIVFCNTRAMVNRVTTRLSNRGFSVVALSGELSQNERTHALQSMRDGRARVCVATDVAARGIDLPNLDLVIHAELPNNHETLLHRSGRTGRAGRKGVSAVIVPPSARRKADRILKSAKLTAEWAAAPSAEDVKARDLDRMLDDPAWSAETTEAEAELVTKLTDKFSSEQIAAAYLKLYQEQHTAPEELSDADEPPRPREAFGASVWFTISGGREDGAEPRRLLPMLCKAGGLTKNDIGAIRIQNRESFVQILEASVEKFLATLGSAMTIEGSDVARSDGPPAGAGGGPRKSGPRNFKDRKDRDRKGRDRNDRDRDERGPKPERKKPESRGTTKPVDWNDDPTPRTKKPKPADRAKSPPKEHKSTDTRAHSAKPKSSEKPKSSAVTARDQKMSDPSKSLRKRGKDGPKGPPPPKGKPNSKKNKARAKFATNQGGKSGGGKAPPRRNKS